jgi:hypothetical protein
MGSWGNTLVSTNLKLERTILATSDVEFQELSEREELSINTRYELTCVRELFSPSIKTCGRINVASRSVQRDT